MYGAYTGIKEMYTEQAMIMERTRMETYTNNALNEQLALPFSPLFGKSQTLFFFLFFFFFVVFVS